MNVPFLVDPFLYITLREGLKMMDSSAECSVERFFRGHVSQEKHLSYQKVDPYQL